MTTNQIILKLKEIKEYLQSNTSMGSIVATEEIGVLIDKLEQTRAKIVIKEVRLKSDGTTEITETNL